MTKPKLTAEIGKLIAAGIAETEDVAERLRICSAEDDKRGSKCYAAAIGKINEAMGYRITGPNSFDVGNIAA